MQSTPRRSRHAALAALLFIGACGDSSAPPPELPPPTSPWTVDAGALKLQVDDNPWRLRFFDAAGREVVAEHAATGPAPLGTLGFYYGPPPAGDGTLPLLPPVVADFPQAPPERTLGWQHATRVLESSRDGDAWTATLATTDPLGRTLRVRVTPQADGVIAIAAEPDATAGIQAMGIGFEATPDERYLGFGERSNAVNQRGRALEHFVGEGPYQDLEYPFVTALVPKWGIRWRRDATYFPMPWLLSSRGHGVLLDDDALSYHRLDAADGWSVEVEQPSLHLRVFAGPKPADAVARLSAALGRQPRDYAPWFFGPWVQSDRDDRIAELRAAGVPISVTATYLHYLPCGDQQGNEAGQPARTSALNAQGTAVHTYFNPMICTSYQPAYAQAVAAGAIMNNRGGEPYVYPYQGSTIFNVAQFDFTTAAGRDFYGTLAREAIGHGYEGWMEDFGEYTPLNAVARDGATGTRGHNRYARDYHCGIFAALAGHDGAPAVGKPLARFVRSGWTGSAACSPLVWGGDPTTGFGFDGLESSIYQALSIGASGVGLWGSDIGGFFALGPTRLSDELLQRWMAFGAFSTVMRTQANGFALPESPRPQVWDALHLPAWRKWSRLRTQLWPYVQSAVEHYYATGLPVMRHHALTHPDDAAAVARDDQYLFGPDLLVAPAYVEGATERTLYLPQGAWLDAAQALAYDEASGRFDLGGGATVLDGGRELTVPAPLGDIPLFIRAGALIPLLPPDVQTLADHGAGIVHASDRDGVLRLLAFPRGSSSAGLYAADTLQSEELPGEWRLSIDATRIRDVEVQAALGALATPFVPGCARAEGGTLSAWDYEPARGVFTAHWRVASGTLHVRAGC